MIARFVLIQARGDVVTEELTDRRLSLQRKQIETMICRVDRVEFVGYERAVLIEAADGP